MPQFAHRPVEIDAFEPRTLCAATRPVGVTLSPTQVESHVQGNYFFRGVTVPTVRPDGLVATIHWGDGKSSPGSVSASGVDPAEADAGGVHIYARPGRYAVRVDLADRAAPHVALGHIRQVVVATPNPTTLIAARAKVGQPFEGVLAVARSAAPFATGGTVSITWGDDTPTAPATVVAIGKRNQTFVIRGTHTYVAPGVYVVQVNDDLVFNNPVGGVTPGLATTEQVTAGTLTVRR